MEFSRLGEFAFWRGRRLKGKRLEFVDSGRRGGSVGEMRQVKKFLSASRMRYFMRTAPESGMETYARLKKENVLTLRHMEVAIASAPIDFAREVYDSMEEKTQDAHAAMTERLVADGKQNEAMDLVLKMKQFLPLERAWRTIFRDVAAQGDINRIHLLMEKMPDEIREGDPQIHEILLKLFCKLDQTDAVIAIIDHIVSRNLHLPVNVYELAIQTLIRCNEHEAALHAFNQLRSRGKKGITVTPTLFKVILPLMKAQTPDKILPLAESLINFYANSKSAGLALKILTILREENRLPAEGIYRTIFNLVCDARLVNEAQNIIAEMRELGFCIGPGDYARLLKAYARRKMIEQAEKKFGELLLDGPMPDAGVYQALLGVYAHSGRDDLAERMFQEMKTFETKPSVGIYGLMIDLCTRYVTISEISSPLEGKS